MNPTPRYRVFDYTLAAGAIETIHRTGTTLICLSADARFDIAFDDGPFTTFEKGLSYKAQVQFQKVRIRNQGTGAIKVELGFASGGISDSRLSLSGAVASNIYGGDTVVSSGVVAANAAVTKVCDAVSTRSEVMVTNLGAKTVYLGPSAVADGQGVPIGEGVTVTLTTQAELHVRNDTGAAINLAVLELNA